MSLSMLLGFMIVIIAECQVRWYKWKQASSLVLPDYGQPSSASTKIFVAESSTMPLVAEGTADGDT